MIDSKTVAERFEGVVAPDVRGGEGISLPRHRAHELLKFLRDDAGLTFNLLIDLTAVDYRGRSPRFEVVYQLYSFATKRRLRVRVGIPEEDPSVDSAHDLWKCADWYEREAFDMFGIRFIGHPDLRRILLFEGFQGHPLRKDYPMERRQKIPVPAEKP